MTRLTILAVLLLAAAYTVNARSNKADSPNTSEEYAWAEPVSRCLAVCLAKAMGQTFLRCGQRSLEFFYGTVFRTVVFRINNWPTLRRGCPT